MRADDSLSPLLQFNLHGHFVSGFSKPMHQLQTDLDTFRFPESF